MPRKKAPHADATNGRTGASEVASASNPSGIPSVSYVSSLQARYEAAFDALRDLYIRDDGWLRVIPQDAGKIVYYKWKFTAGPWRNHYVMYRDDENNPAKAFAALESKVHDVDVGTRRPALDVPYDAS